MRFTLPRGLSWAASLGASTSGLALAGGCAPETTAYLLECAGSQTFTWSRTQARNLTTQYYRIDEAQQTIFATNTPGHFDHVCRSSCAELSFEPDAITWTDIGTDAAGRTTRVSSRLARASGELTIRTQSSSPGPFGPEQTLDGEGTFHCHKIDAIPPIPGAPS